MLLFIGGVLFGAFFKGYFTQKGENLATHEDIKKLDDQMRVLTTTAKTIEAEISDAVWSRQRRSELKRYVLLEASWKLAEFNDAMVSLAAAVSVKSDDRQLESISTPDDR